MQGSSKYSSVDRACAINYPPTNPRLHAQYAMCVDTLTQGIDSNEYGNPSPIIQDVITGACYNTCKSKDGILHPKGECMEACVIAGNIAFTPSQKEGFDYYGLKRGMLDSNGVVIIILLVIAFALAVWLAYKK